ncbi:hypothetical protein LADH09A_003547 [Micromonospora sp. LAH09]|uniref:hypothetical protein n=1 Tax=Micromonospora cabrerizensis TaxID=2911213 RepID=UPI001EE97060|nr:hypothetical protein [Micromonospora cabrerizensis]MCG5469629.1 hypothetical protein [Micromonospora cabrerizensis]
MTRSPSIRLRRRGVLGIPALVAVALTVVTRPSSASAAPPSEASAAPKAECLADLIQGF